MELPRRLNWIRNRPWRPHVCRREFNRLLRGLLQTRDRTTNTEKYKERVYQAAAGHSMGAAVSVVPVCTAGMQRLYCCHCLMPSVHSGTGTERQRVNEREKRIQLWNRERQNTIAAGVREKRGRGLGGGNKSGNDARG
ncbi:hypothetical protein PAMP_008075 [Pampus punctatissimus]